MLKEILIYISVYVGLFAVTFYIIGLLKGKKESPEFPEKNPPKVSIIIPAFNEEKGIAGTIRSVLRLDYPRNKLEVIVVDDGSTDNTYKIVSKFKSKVVRVFREENQGKGTAINLGLKKARGEVIITMDADNTHVNRDALKKMIPLFNNPKTMCVSPAIAIYKPKGILQRIQQVEYLLGVFLRKAFSTLNAIHITPGAFSAYRKSFFDKYGGFDEDNLTEDMEVCLRIQKHNLIVDNADKAIVYAVAPKTFGKLLKQRRRWYVGLLRNLWNYKKLFSRKYGDMGTVVLPVAIITIVMSILLTSYLVINAFFEIKKDLALLESVNFDFLSSFDFNKYLVERYVFLIFSDPVFLFLFLFIFILLGYMFFAKKRVKEHSNIKLSIFFFIGIYNKVRC